MVTPTAIRMMQATRVRMLRPSTANMRGYELPVPGPFGVSQTECTITKRDGLLLMILLFLASSTAKTESLITSASSRAMMGNDSGGRFVRKPPSYETIPSAG